MEAFCDAVVASKAPHGADLGGPGGQGLSEGDELWKAGILELINGTEEARGELLTLFAGSMLFEQQITEALFETVDGLHSG